MVDIEHIALAARDAFLGLGFTGNANNGPRYFAYTKKGERDDCGSVFWDGVSVTYYINGHVGFLSPATFGPGDEERVKEDIAAHMFENTRPAARPLPLAR